MKLVDRQPQRLFAFGCSYTQYAWATWPEIVAYDLQIPMYNAARAGAGNQFIANLLSQANQLYKFNPDDLVMISWSGFLREDRWIRDSWRVHGDFNQIPSVFQYPESVMSDKFIEDFSDPTGYYVRDFATVALVKDMLESCGCQHHMFSIYDIPFVYDSENTEFSNKAHTLSRMMDLYQGVMSGILGSFDSVLWNSDQHAHKSPQALERWDNKWTDWHPTTDEQFLFLQRTFDEHKFSDRTRAAVDTVFSEFSNFMKSLIARPELLNPQTGTLQTFDLPEPEWTQFNKNFHLAENQMDLAKLLW
jgi:hypothetical protein